MKFFFGLIILITTVPLAFAQRQAAAWYFGNRAGLVFTADTVMAVLNSQMITDEGCATYCDSNGRLLFYTDGIKVWNRLNAHMPNGINLAGDSSATQAAVIVPFISDSNKYYIFTVDREGNRKGLQYSVVDMSADFGLGDVTVKNRRLENHVSEKLTAVMHRNRRDVWIISHRWNSRQFVAYLVTANGVNSIPVVSETGSYHGGNMYNSIGYLKAAPNGRKLASVIHAVDGECQVLDFDNATGVISNPFKLTGLKRPYGVEFSANGTFLYTGDYHNPSRVFQYHLYKGDSNKINSSRILIASLKTGEGMGAYQLGPDRKIYITHYNKAKLSIIHDPDKEGGDCNFELEGKDLLKRNAMLGLPNFNQSLFSYEVITDFLSDTVCQGKPTAFIERSNASPYQWHWNFGDPASGPDNISDKKNPTHIYTSAGKYFAKLTTTVAGYEYAVTKQVLVLETPVVALGEDAIYCAGDTITLNAGNKQQKNQAFLWSTGDTSASIKVYSSGKYWAHVRIGTCMQTDTVNIAFVNTDSINLGNDTSICELASLWLKGNLNGAKYMWNNGSTDDSIRVTKTGWYKLTAKVDRCVVADSVYAMVYPEPKAFIGLDTALCEYEEKELDAGSFGLQYLWNTGETTRNITVQKRGTYWVNIYTGECFSTDTIVLSACQPVTYIPNVFTPNNDGINDEFRIIGKDLHQSQLLIYNRWGECVFESNDINTGWDGRYKGNMCPQDTYLWVLRYNSALTPKKDFTMLKGLVHLVE